MKQPEFISLSPESEESSWQKMSQAYLGRDVTPAEISSYWTRRSLSESAEKPGFFVKNTLREIVLLIHAAVLDDNYSLDYALERFWVLRLLQPLWVMVFLGLGGLVVSLRSYPRKHPLVYLIPGRIDEATTHFRKALQMQPDGSTELLKISLEAKKNNTPQEEIKKQLEQLKHWKEDELFDIDYIEGVKFMRQQQYEQAIPYFEKALAKFPDNGQILTNLGSAYKNTEQLEKAKESLSRAILLDGYNLSARYNMGNLLRKKKEADLAFTQFSIINSLVPGYMLTQLQLAELQLAKGNSSAARELYQQFLDDKGNSSLYPDQIFKAREALGKFR